MSDATEREPKHRWFIWLVLTAIPVIIAVFAYRADRLKELEAKLTRFQEAISTAQHMYCQQQALGVQLELQSFVDNAAKLEKVVKDELLPIDYVTLASVGSYFWSPQKARGYAERGLELATANDDRLTRYAACRVLAHVDFLEFKEGKRQELLKRGRDRCADALKIISSQQSPDNSHLAGELYLSLGQNEGYVQNSQESEDAFKQAAKWLQDAEHPETVVYRIAGAKEWVKEERAASNTTNSTWTT